MDFEEFLNLFRFSHKFAGVERTTKLAAREAWETDAEHSFQLALLAWYLNESLNLKLNRQKILEYALAHDLVEVYAGDTDPHRHSQEFIASKGRREEAAFAKIKNEFLKFRSLHEAMEGSKNLADDESKFVYLLDKIVPVINTYISDDNYYYANNVTYKKWQEWLEEKRNKVKFSNADFNQLLDEVDKFFGKVPPGFFK